MIILHLCKKLSLVGLVSLIFGLGTFSLFLWPAQPIHAAGAVTDCTAFGTPATAGSLAQALVGGGLVTFNCSGTIIVPEIEISQTTTIQGGGVITLSGNGANRVFSVTNGSLTLDGLGVINGQSEFGSAVYVNPGGNTLTIRNTILRNNTATDSGGAIFIFAGSQPTVIEDSWLLDNQAGVSGGAIYLENSNLILRRVKVINNQAGSNDGGGVAVVNLVGTTNQLTIQDSRFSQNQAADEGGGVLVATVNITTSIQVDITGSTFDGNTADEGGGLRLEGVNGSLTVNFSRSTLSGNRATGNDGGGLSQNFGNLTMTDLTFAENRAGQRGGGFRLDGPVTATIQNSLVAQNISDVDNGPDCNRSFNSSLTSNGHNLIGTQQGCFNIFDIAKQDQFGPDNPFRLDPIIGPLSDNGGPTPTIPVLAGSPALNAGTCLAGTDQRGVTRPLGPACDIGAYEAPAIPPAIVTKCLDQSQLQALLNAGPDGIVITFDCPGPIPISGTHLEASAHSVTIDGALAGGGTMILQGDGSSRIFNVESGRQLTLQNLILEGGNPGAGLPGGAIRVNNNSRVTLLTTTLRSNQAVRGGAVVVKNGSELRVEASTLSSNTASGGAGGAVLLEDAGSRASFTNTLISQNQAQGGGAGNGGGIASLASVSEQHTLRLHSTTVSQNNATGLGGGMYIDRRGQTTTAVELLAGTQLNQNQATQGGGLAVNIQGFQSKQVNVTMNDSQVSGNTATAGGGGGLSVDAIEGGQFNGQFSNSQINGNTASNEGGGLWLKQTGFRDSTLTLNQVIVSGNTATTGQGGGVSLSVLDTSGGQLTTNLSQSTISNNTAAAGNGGGLALNSATTGEVELTIRQSTIADNQAATGSTGGGGGLYLNRDGANSSQVVIDQSILRGNRAGSNGGGGGWSAGNGSQGYLTMVNSTLSGNQAQIGGPGGGWRSSNWQTDLTYMTVVSNVSSGGAGGGLRVDDAANAQVSLHSTVLALNQAATGPDCNRGANGQLGSIGFNLLGNEQNCNGDFDVSRSDLIGTAATPIDPRLAPLADNGGPTLSHLPLADSPVIIDDIPGVCGGTLVNNLDQRGQPRPVGSGCDIGSVEFNTGKPEFVVNKTAQMNPSFPTAGSIIQGRPFDYRLTVENQGAFSGTGVLLREFLPANSQFINASDGGTLADPGAGRVDWLIPQISDGETVQRTLTLSSCQSQLVNSVYRVVSSDQGVNTGLGPVLTTTLAAPTVLANFTFAAAGQTVQFTDQSGGSGGPIVAWDWDLGESGATFTQTNPVYEYVGAGLKTVRLVVTDTCGYRGEVQQNIQVGNLSLAAALQPFDSQGKPLSQVTPGQEVSYRVWISNTGVLTISDINALNFIPAHTSLVPGSLQPTGPQFGPPTPVNGGQLVVGLTLLPGQSQLLTYRIKVAQPLTNGLILNSPLTVTTTTPDVPPVSPVTASLTVVASSSLQLLKTVSGVQPPADNPTLLPGNQIRPGSLITYHVAFSLSGTAPASGVGLADTLPPFSQLVSSSGRAPNGQVLPAPQTTPATNPQSSGPNLWWNLGDLSPGTSSGRLTISVRIGRPLTAGLILTNTAWLSSQQQLDGVRATVSHTVVASQGLQLKLTVSDPPSAIVEPGGQLTYTLAYSLVGDAPASNLFMVAQLPPESRFLSASPTSDGRPVVGQPVVGATGEVVWRLGRQLTATSGLTQYHGTANLVVRVVEPLVDGQILTLNGQLQSEQQPTGVNNTVTATIRGPALQVSKSTLTPRVIAGKLAIYTLRIENQGRLTATQVTISDTLPTGFSYLRTTQINLISASQVLTLTPTVGVTQATWGQWTIGPGGAVDLIFETRASLKSGTYHNSAQVSSPDSPADNPALVYDGELPALRAEDVTIDQFPEVSVSKSVLQGGAGQQPATPQVLAGEVVTFAIRLQNIGTADAVGVVMTDTLPTGFRYQSHQLILDELATCDDSQRPQSGDTSPSWALCRLPVGASLTVTVQALVSRAVPAGIYDNRAVVEAQTPLAGQSIGQASVEVVRQAELLINKMTTTPVVTTGQLAEYQLVVYNAGTASAERLEVSDDLPTGFSYVSSQITGVAAQRVVTQTPAVGDTALLWRGWTLESGGWLTISVAAAVGAEAQEQTYNNGLTVSADGLTVQDDPLIGGDANTLPGDTASDDDVTVVAAAQLNLSQTVQPVTLPAGEQLTITLKVVNQGAETADGVTLNLDLLQGPGQPQPGGPSGLPTPQVVAMQVISGLSVGRMTALNRSDLNVDLLNQQRQYLAHPAVLSRQSNLENNEWVLAPGGSVVVTLTLVVPVSQDAGQYESRATANSLTAGSVTRSDLFTVSREAVVWVNLSTSTPVVRPGETATYQAVVQNVGLEPAQGVVLTAVLPAGGFAYQNTVAVVGQDVTTGTVSRPNSGDTRPSWGSWTLAPGGQLTVTFQVDVFGFALEGTYDSTLLVESSSLVNQWPNGIVADDGQLAGEPGTPPGSDTGVDEDVTVGDLAALRVNKQTVNLTGSSSEPVLYVVTVENVGTIPADAVQLVDTLPTGFQYQATLGIQELAAQRTSQQNPTPGSQELRWGQWQIARQGQLVLTYQVVISAGLTPGSYINQVTADHQAGTILPGQPAQAEAEVTVVTPKARLVYLPVMLKMEPVLPSPTPTPTGTAIVTPTPTSTGLPPTPTATPTPTVSPTPATEPPTPVVAPDLRVDRLVATSREVIVVVTNQGNAPVTQEFWVDLYVDPDPPPTQVNQVWYDAGRSIEGIAWGVTSSALPLAPGEVLVLRYSNEAGAANLYVAPEYSRFSGTLAGGTPVYVQVDSVNSNTTYGAVLETHEITGEPYNNISLSALTTSATLSGLELPTSDHQPSVASPTSLPARPYFKTSND